MTPMIDVVFLLLIFFVCASSGRLKELLLPTPLAAETLENQTLQESGATQEKVWIKIGVTDTEQPTFQLNNREISSLEELKLNLEEIGTDFPEIPVILDAGDRVPMEVLLQVYDTCQAVQFEEISFAIEKPQVSR